MKQFIRTTVLILIALLSNATASAYDFEKDGFYYNINNASAKTITVTGESYQHIGNLEIPASVEYDGDIYSVTSIGRSAFNQCTAITSVIIPNSVTTIEDAAFYGSKNIHTLTIGTGVISIAPYAFVYDVIYQQNTPDLIYYIPITKCFWLGNTPPETDRSVMASINYVANDMYKLRNQVIYPYLSSLFTIDGTMYVPISPSEKTCDVISSDYQSENGNITICDKVTYKGVEMTVLNINDYSFYKNPTIENVTIDYKGNIGKYAFYDCDALKSVMVKNSWQINEKAFYDCNALETITVNNAGNIESEAFANAGALTNVNINNNGDIGEKAFYKSLGVFDLQISNNGNIKSSAFEACEGLTEVNITSNGDIEASAFSGCISIEKADINNTGAIGKSAFSGCRSIKSIILGNSITSIDSYAFSGCSSLLSITIPDNVKKIGPSLFRGCEQLSAINLGNGITSIQDETFYGCKSLNAISVPGQIEYIFSDVFSGCSALADVTFENSESALHFYNGPIFADCPLDEVYIGRKLLYSTGSSTESSPFYRNRSLRSVEITDAETQIYDNEFYGCSNLQSLTIGNGVTTIGKWAFSGCSSLEYFSAGYNVSAIGEEAFSDCTGLKNFYSYSSVPPTCGAQALDDINKWECTLHVPAESADEYQAAEQWKEFFFVNEMEVVPVAEIHMTSEIPVLHVGDTFQFSAEVLPANATNKILTWSSSDSEVATIDANGLLTVLSEGTTTITVRSQDGNTECECSVNVEPLNVNGISEITADTYKNDEVYTQQGVKIAKPARPGIYIVNGKKLRL